MASLLKRTRAEHGLPSICAGAVVDCKIVYCGSITQSFTTALYATFVQQDVCAWLTPMRSFFMSFAKEIDPTFLKVTPLDLMAHRAGLPSASWPSGDVLALQA